MATPDTLRPKVFYNDLLESSIANAKTASTKVHGSSVIMQVQEQIGATKAGRECRLRCFSSMNTNQTTHQCCYGEIFREELPTYDFKFLSEVVSDFSTGLREQDLEETTFDTPAARRTLIKILELDEDVLLELEDDVEMIDPISRPRLMDLHQTVILLLRQIRRLSKTNHDSDGLLALKRNDIAVAE
jgi:hypothetical protein